jgi:hypothetical protein
MSSPHSTTVHVVVAPEYGERLRELPGHDESWVADTAGNDPVIQAIWAERAPHVPPGGITSFVVAPDETPEDWLFDVLGTIDMHHGQDSVPPLYSVLRVVGIGLSARVQEEFKSYGFTKFEESADGFIAHKIVDAA